MNMPSTKAIETTKSASFSKRIVFSLLKKLTAGHIRLIENGNEALFGDSHADIKATITIHDQKAYSRILWGGSIGAGEAYVEGLWSSENLVDVIRLFSRNLAALEKHEQRFGFLLNIINMVKHRLNRNSKAGSRTNIAAHYDLSNEMYRFFLDEAMQYSSGIFPHETTTLEEAQQHKLKTICEALNLTEDDQLLEIGTGWGGLACYAAKNYGCHVTTTTISDAQFDLAQQRINDENLSHKITLLKKDYRDLTGQYSKIVSIEMIEAVGHKFMSTYFEMLDQLLKPGGKSFIQAITMNDQRYDNYVNNVDFIQRNIFPGGHLPSVSVMCDLLKNNTNMYMKQLSDYRIDYAKTLSAWRASFLDNREAIQSLGFNDDFIRLWEYYFSYCEGGFRESAIGLAHIELIKNEY
ncbi:MAG: class I SAM-dependent methyltransferase [Oceanospirillaceae bacterium]|jgi:cyclopropane-fatty-acyl-phospholipid synthase|nr:class I SAM-dependent methyltransferase [Oceanospirillaceae bacterium]MBT7330529.1 class I SAM-dependent methyltransferase [Oceanospirillaceae bacterium]